jgi:hypothetical protein
MTTATKTRSRKSTRRTIADTVAALHVARVRLDQAIAEFVPWPLCRWNAATGEFEHVPGKFSEAFTLEDLQRCRRNLRKVGALLAQRPNRGFRTLSDRVLRTIERLENEHDRTTPGLEGACLAMQLAERCADDVDTAMQLAIQMIGQELSAGLFFQPAMTIDDVLSPRRRGR